MALLTIPNTFSAGATIIASQHNANFSTIYTDYNGNITNINVSGFAAIAYSKLNLSGNIVNTDINNSAAIVGSKLDLTSPGAIGSTSPSTGAFSTLKVGTTNQGDILYDNGTTFTRLTPGANGQVLQTKGAGANPQWAAGAIGNTLFEYHGYVDQVGANKGEITNAGLTPTGVSGVYRYLQSNNAAGDTIWTSKFIKTSLINTVTIYTRTWVNTGIANPSIKVDIGGQNNNAGAVSNTTPAWKTYTINVSGLSNGTTYDVTCTAFAPAGNIYCSDIMGFSS
jgi:hypothetical protein